MQEFHSSDGNTPNRESSVNNTGYLDGSGGFSAAPNAWAAQSEFRRWQNGELEHLRQLSRAGGCALLLVCTLQLVMGVGLALLEEPAMRFAQELLPGVNANTIDVFWNGFTYVLVGLFAIMPGALLGLRMLSPEDNNLSLPFRRPADHPPVSKSTTMKVVLAGAFLCLMGNFATILLSTFANRFGYDFTGPENTPSENTIGLLFMTFASAIIPGICEELFMRGMIMQPLRRYGDRFALVASAFLFAVLHQNMVQAPMAFCAGLALGWATMKTGTLWAAIFIHIWNNGASAILLALEKPLGDNSGYAILVYAPLLAMAGIFCLASLARDSGGKETKVKHPIKPGIRTSNYFFGSPAMVIVLIYMFAMLALGVRAMT